MQPLASVTVAVCKPAERLLDVAVLEPFVQLNEYGGAPPFAETEAEPSFPPKVLMAVTKSVWQVRTGGELTLTEFKTEQPLAPAIVTVYVPTAKLLIAATVAPVFQE